MSKCNHCSSYVINIDPEQEVCDVCFYKTVLIDVAHKIENDIAGLEAGIKELYTSKGEKEPSTVRLTIDMIKVYLKPMHKAIFTRKDKG